MEISETNGNVTDQSRRQGQNSTAVTPPLFICRGIRGATSAPANTADAILSATRELLTELIEANGIEVESIASIHFTATPDLNAIHPALAARQLGWYDTALLCSQEIAVPGSLPRCLRVLIHWNTTKRPSEIRHIYLHEAVALRPDRQQL